MTGWLKPSFENAGNGWGHKGGNVKEHEVVWPERAHQPDGGSDSFFSRARRWFSDEDDMVQLLLPVSAEDALDECRQRGLADRELGRQGNRHWRVRMPGRPGHLELSELDGRAWVEVDTERDGWANRIASELAAPKTFSA